MVTLYIGCVCLASMTYNSWLQKCCSHHCWLSHADTSPHSIKLITLKSGSTLAFFFSSCTRWLKHSHYCFEAIQAQLSQGHNKSALQDVALKRAYKHVNNFWQKYAIEMGKYVSLCLIQNLTFGLCVCSGALPSTPVYSLTQCRGCKHWLMTRICEIWPVWHNSHDYKWCCFHTEYLLAKLCGYFASRY